MSKGFRSPTAAREEATRIYERRRSELVNGTASWPSIFLGNVTERDLREDYTGFIAWSRSWESWASGGTVEWEERRWTTFGEHRVPVRLTMLDETTLAKVADRSKEYARVKAAASRLVEAVPEMAGKVGGLYRSLNTAEPRDIEIIIELVAWLRTHPASGLRVRNIPVIGMHSKWIETHEGLVRTVCQAVFGQVPVDNDFSLPGIRGHLSVYRVILLDKTMRQRYGGLRDISVPLEELRTLDVSPRVVLAIENLQTVVAFPDMEGVVAVLRLGSAITKMATVPWIAAADVVYWGDLDQAGLTILGSLRERIPGTKSILMDRATYERYARLREKDPGDARSTHGLLEEERQLLADMRAGTFGLNSRLEQERIPFDAAMVAIEAACSGSYARKTGNMYG